MKDRVFKIIYLNIGTLLLFWGIVGLFASELHSGTVFLLISGAIFALCGAFISKIHFGLRYGFLALFFLGVGFLVWVYAYGENDTATFEEDAVIVLGAQVRGERPSPRLEQRLESAYSYYKKNPNCVIIVTGGKGDDEIISEASAMEKYLIDLGVPEEKIIKEDRSTSTKENLENAKIILDEHFKEPYTVTIITSNYHIYRGCLNAKSVGFENVSTFHSETSWFSVFSSGVRECLGILAYWILGYA